MGFEPKPFEPDQVKRKLSVQIPIEKNSFFTIRFSLWKFFRIIIISFLDSLAITTPPPSHTQTHSSCTFYPCFYQNIFTALSHYRFKWYRTGPFQIMSAKFKFLTSALPLCSIVIFFGFLHLPSLLSSSSTVHPYYSYIYTLPEWSENVLCICTSCVRLSRYLTKSRNQQIIDSMTHRLVEVMIPATSRWVSSRCVAMMYYMLQQVDGSHRTVAGMMPATGRWVGQQANDQLGTGFCQITLDVLCGGNECLIHSVHTCHNDQRKCHLT